MLNKLGFKKKTHVGICLSANNFIEFICIDKATKTVTKYLYDNVKYNNAIREIIEFEEFEEVIQRLFDESGLNPADCSVTLSLPNVQFGIASLDSVSEEPYIIENLQSEIEDLYIFKRNQPEISYVVMETETGRKQKNIVYSAIQEKIRNKIIEIFDQMEIEIERIDISISSMFKAIQYCDRFNKYIAKEEKTSILLITSSSCSSFYLNGPNITDYAEEPLAIKSFSIEEVYSTIKKIIENNISKNNPQSLLIISEADEVNAELLSKNLNFEGEIDFFDKNVNSNEPFINVLDEHTDIDSNDLSFMTLEAVGAAVASFDEYPLDNINFLPKERISKNIVEVFGYEVDFYRFISVIFIIAIIAAAILSGLFCFVFNYNISSTQEQSNKDSKDIQVFKKNISDAEQQRKKDILPILTKILETNKSVVDVYNALSTDIPESIYIRKFVTNSEGGMGIIGESKTSEAVEEFVNRLREKNGDLMLARLSINTKEDPIEPRIPDGFTFEIKTAHTPISFDENELSMIMNEVNQKIQNMQGSSKRNNSSRITPPPSPVI